MNNIYLNSKIYKLVSNKTKDVYYGATTNELRKRLYQHRCDYKKYSQNNDHYYVTSYELVKYIDCKIILIEKYPCNDKDELNARERFFIENFDCVNKTVPGRSDKERYEENRDEILEKCKVYRKTNKEKINKSKKDNYEKYKPVVKAYQKKNKEQIKKKHELYIQNHREEIREYQKDYDKKYREQHKEKLKLKEKENYQKNKEKLKIKIDCICGKKITSGGMIKHTKNFCAATLPFN